MTYASRKKINFFLGGKAEKCVLYLIGYTLHHYYYYWVFHRLFLSEIQCI